jgi:hypothetical protein
MIRGATALLAGLLLATGIAACGGGNSDTADVVPKTTPDLVAPKDTSLPQVTVATTDTTSSTTTPSSSATSSGTGAATPSGTTGTGAASGAGATGTGGGTAAGTGTTGGGSGGFGSFCSQNPGSC